MSRPSARSVAGIALLSALGCQSNPVQVPPSVEALEVSSDELAGSVVSIVATFQPPAPDRPGRRGTTQRRPEERAGSGALIWSDGSILTSRELVNGAAQIQIALADRRVFEAKLIQSDEASGLALLRVFATGLKCRPISNAGQLAIGDTVMAVALNAEGQPVVLRASVRVKGRDHVVVRYGAIISGQPGAGQSLGAGVFDAHGRLVGISASREWGSVGENAIGFAMPSERSLAWVGHARNGTPSSNHPAPIEAPTAPLLVDALANRAPNPN